MIKKVCNHIYREENLRENLIELNRLVKDEENLDQFLDEYYENESVYMHLLDHEDPKVRKNGIKLLAKVADQVLLDPLFEHYMHDETQFLKAEYLSAFEAFDYTAYLPQLKVKRLVLEKAERTKHIREELKQIKRLIWKVEPPVRHTFSGDHLEHDLLCIVTRGFEEVFLNQIADIPDTKGRALKGGCLVHTSHLTDVAALRTYQAILFDAFPKSVFESNGKSIGKALLDQGLLDYIFARHVEKSPFFFRVEVKGIEDIRSKNKLALDLSRYLEENSAGMLENEPSFYEIEIRIIVGKKGCRAFLKMTCMNDERFLYRKYVTASSMQPSRAALILNFAKKYLKEDANILDPFCGTGTLLIERAKMMGYRSLYGLDISEPAIQAARENSHRAEVILNLIQRNFNDFKHEYLFDEIITDLPRKSENRFKDQTMEIYKMFFEQSFKLLALDGVMIVYTEDEGGMEKVLKTAEWASLIEKQPVGMGHTSWLFIIKRMK